MLIVGLRCEHVPNPAGLNVDISGCGVLRVAEFAFSGSGLWDVQAADFGVLIMALRTY